MKSTISLLSLLAVTVSASVLSTTNIATVLAGVTSQSSLTIPADAMAAIAKLGTGGANAATLSAADNTALSNCANAARDQDAADLQGANDGRGSAGAILFDTNKVTIHACESAQQQVGLASGTAASDTDINLLISNVAALNTENGASGSKAKRAMVFVS